MSTPKNILVVDDDDITRLKITRLLKNSGFTTEDKENGCQALGALEKASYDLMITDLQMPKMDGMDLLKAARKLQPDLKFIMITAFGEIDSYLEAKTLGAFEYLNKPVKADELICIVNKVLEQK